MTRGRDLLRIQDVHTVPVVYDAADVGRWRSFVVGARGGETMARVMPVDADRCARSWRDNGASALGQDVTTLIDVRRWRRVCRNADMGFIFFAAVRRFPVSEPCLLQRRRLWERWRGGIDLTQRVSVPGPSVASSRLVLTHHASTCCVYQCGRVIYARRACVHVREYARKPRNVCVYVRPIASLLWIQQTISVERIATMYCCHIWPLGVVTWCRVVSLK